MRNRRAWRKTSGKIIKARRVFVSLFKSSTIWRLWAKDKGTGSALLSENMAFLIFFTNYFCPLHSIKKRAYNPCSFMTGNIRTCYFSLYLHKETFKGTQEAAQT